MGLIVQKYGGSSVSDAAAVKRVAQRIVASSNDGHEVVVVVSAMGDTTDELLDLASQVSPLPAGRELDMLLTAGERISMALLAMAIGDLGHQARSFTGSQAGSSPRRRTAAHESSTSRPAESDRRSTEVRLRSSRGFRASARTARTSRHSAEAAPIRRRLRSRQRSAPTSVRSIPTSMASSPPTPGSSPRPVGSHASPTRRCSKWPHAAPRSCTCGA